jgi:hypothetical protein
MRAYCFVYNLNASGGDDVFYATLFDVPILGNYAWTKHDLTSGESLAFPLPSATGGATFSVGTDQIYQWDLTALQDFVTSIAPFFDTGDYVLDEKDLTAFQEWYMACNQDGSATWANNLDIEIQIDGAVVGSYTSLTQANNFFKSLMPLTAFGRRIRFRYNINGTKATYKKDAAANDDLQIIEVGFSGEIRKLLGDASHSL